METTPNDFRLSGKRVLLTGAGRGIGKGIAHAMAEAGAQVAINSLGNESCEQTAQELRDAGWRAFGYAADATRVAPMEAVRERIDRDLGGIDVLVNCVGDSVRTLLVSIPGDSTPVMTEDDWHKIIDVNLTQAFVGCHVFGPQLLERGPDASVINISSFAAVRPGAGMVAYSAAKAGLTRFTESLALEWAPLRVRVNAIAPGQFPDVYQLAPDERESRIQAGGANTPLGRAGRMEEVGSLAVYLASEAAAFIIGQTFVIDGGRTLL